jgi:DNA-binding beta-propeller fold protein YncE
MIRKAGRDPLIPVFVFLALALVAGAGSLSTAHAQSTETAQQFWHIPAGPRPGAWQDNTALYPKRCVGSLAPRSDSLVPKSRTVTVRFLRSRRVEARPDFGGYRIYRCTSTPDTTTAMLLRRYSVNEGDEPLWNFSRVNDDVYVADIGNHRIQKFTSTGNYLTRWGISGSGNGQFQSPSGVAVDAVGHVYVADTENHRIQKFESDSTYLTQWGTEGAENGQFDHPSGVAVDSSGNVYVVDTGNHRIQRFDSEGYDTQWGTYGSGDGQFSSPQGVAVDGSGNMYVVDTGNHRIQKFDSGGYSTQWGTYGSGDGQFIFPSGAALDDSGNVYVADTGNHRIQKFTSIGTYLTQWGVSGTGIGQFDGPSGVVVDASGNIFVAESGNQRIQKFNSRGAYVTKWGSIGSGDGKFNGPMGVATDAAGLPFKCREAVVHDSVLTFVDPDSSGALVKVCRDLDPQGRCISPRDSVWALMPVPGPHDGFRTWYTVTYEAYNTIDNTYEDLFVPDTGDDYVRCGEHGVARTCPNLNNKLANMIAVPVEPTAGPTVNLRTVTVVPNPFRGRESWDLPNGNEVQFKNLPPKARIRIYTVAGDLVRDLSHTESVRDFERWDLKNASGRDVASGIYMYRVESGTFFAQGHFIIIR